MATLTKQKTENSVWSSIFPEDVATETKSALFVKKLLAVAISNFAYLRAMFPESAFGNRCLEDISLKILRDDTACPGACQVIKWIKACFDAIDKKYLHTLAVVISGTEDVMSNVIETYTFRFSYKDGEVYSSINRGDEKIHEYMPPDTKKETVRLLRTILVLTQSLDNLPSQCYMAMRLTYYDEVTPGDYEPPGFRSSDTSEYTFECEPITIKVGDIGTPYHDLKLRLKTDKKNFAITTQDEEGAHVNIDNRSPKEAPCDEPMAEGATGEILNKDTCPMSEDLANVGKDYEVRCICGQNEDYGILVTCCRCRTWQHGICFGILDEDSKQDKHCCYQCLTAADGLSRTTAAMTFAGAKDVEQARDLSLWRRTLHACTQMTSVNPRALSRKFKVDHNVAVGLVNRLEKEGIFGKTVKSKARKTINTSVLEERMRPFFKRRGEAGLEQPSENSVDDQPMEYSVNAYEEPRMQESRPKVARSKRKGDIVELDSSQEEVRVMTSKKRKYSISNPVEL